MSVTKLRSGKTQAAAARPCNRCQEVKPLSGFHRDSARPDGHKTICRDCLNAERKEQSFVSPHEPVAKRDERRVKCSHQGCETFINPYNLAGGWTTCMRHSPAYTRF